MRRRRPPANAIRNTQRIVLEKVGILADLLALQPRLNYAPVVSNRRLQPLAVQIGQRLRQLVRVLRRRRTRRTRPTVEQKVGKLMQKPVLLSCIGHRHSRLTALGQAKGRRMKDERRRQPAALSMVAAAPRCYTRVVPARAGAAKPRLPLRRQKKLNDALPPAA